MVIKNATIERIRKIIEKDFNRLSIAILGKKNVPDYIKEQFPNLDSKSLLQAAYYHNFINEQDKEGIPKTLQEMEAQQTPETIPYGEAHDEAVNFLNSNIYQLLQKHKAEVEAQIIGIIRDNNNRYKNDALQNLDRSDYQDSIVKEKTLDELKGRLAEYVGAGATKDWDRIVNTEVSNAIGQGSVDQVVARNKSSDPDQVYVYRINPDDGKTCKYCRRFYIDSDGSPKVYTLSKILSNGTNYGRKADSWTPVAGATHPNCRDSQLIELRPGWAVKSGGTVTFIGLDAWTAYIRQKVSA